MTLLDLDHSFARELDGFGAPWEPSDVPAPTLVRFNDDLASALGLDPDAPVWVGGSTHPGTRIRRFPVQVQGMQATGS